MQLAQWGLLCFASYDLACLNMATWLTDVAVNMRYKTFLHTVRSRQAHLASKYPLEFPLDTSVIV